MSKDSLPSLKGRVIRCVLFDLGDTLWYRKDMHTWHRLETASNRRAAALLRTQVTSDLLADMDDVLLGKQLRDELDTQTRMAIRQHPEIERNGPLITTRVIERLGLGPVDLATGAAVFEALRIRIPESRPLFDDVLPTLAELRQRGFLLGVVTNRLWGGKLFEEDLHTLGLLDYFDLPNIATSADLGVRKPGAAIFMHALNALEVLPTHAAMVGDSLRSDIVGARALGIFAIWKPKPHVRAALKAHLVAPGVSSGGHQDQAPPASPQEELPSDLPPGMHITDDDYILSFVQRHDNRYKWDPLHNDEIRPDLTIEHLSDLLDVLLKPGEQ